MYSCCSKRADIFSPETQKTKQQILTKYCRLFDKILILTTVSTHSNTKSISCRVVSEELNFLLTTLHSHLTHQDSGIPIRKFQQFLKRWSYKLIPCIWISNYVVELKYAQMNINSASKIVHTQHFFDISISNFAYLIKLENKQNIIENLQFPSNCWWYFFNSIVIF